MGRFRDLLARDFTVPEQAVIQGLQAEVENLRSSCESLSLEDLRAGLVRLAPLRLQASSSLKRGEVESWQQANEYVAGKMRSEQPVTLQALLELNATLTGIPQGRWRDRAVFIGHQEACPVAELEESLQYFESAILKSSEVPVVKAALVQYWLVSLHPFEDGSGRTAILAADWILGEAGYLPMSFATKLDGLVGFFDGQRSSATPGAAVIKLLKNVQRSYLTVLSR